MCVIRVLACPHAQCVCARTCMCAGKTFTMAHVINAHRRPTLLLCHNKTLAAQLARELKSYFPRNSVELFVSYYNYYQPEAYLPGSDTYIAKTTSINDELDALRHRATRALCERQDVIVVSTGKNP